MTAGIQGQYYPDPLCRRPTRPGWASHSSPFPARQRPDIPICLAAIGPKNVALAAEIADGWLPVFFSPKRDGHVQGVPRLRFRARRGKQVARRFDLAPPVAGDAEERASRPAAPCVRAPGSRSTSAAWARAARTTQRPRLPLRLPRRRPRPSRTSYLAGKKDEAAAAGARRPRRTVALQPQGAHPPSRPGIWKGSGVSTMICGMAKVKSLQLMAELVPLRIAALKPAAQRRPVRAPPSWRGLARAVVELSRREAHLPAGGRRGRSGRRADPPSLMLRSGRCAGHGDRVRGQPGGRGQAGATPGGASASRRPPNRQTGDRVPIGGVPPFAHDTALPIWVDEDLLRHDLIYAAAAGVPGVRLSR